MDEITIDNIKIMLDNIVNAYSESIEEDRMKDDAERLCLKDMDYPAYRKGKMDARKGIFGFNPFCPGSLRYLSYEAGNY